MTKGKNKSSLVAAISILAISLMICGFFSVTVRAEIPPAVSLWVEPANMNITTAAYAIGDKFNVTVWVNTEVNSSYVKIYAWQVLLSFNSSLLNVTRAGYTAGGTSQFFSGHTTISLPVNYRADSVLIGENLQSDDFKAPDNGSLCWIEFQIRAAPTGNNTLTCPLKINNTDTFMLDPDQFVVPDVILHDGVYNFAIPPPDTTPPTIANVSRDPSTDQVAENTTVTVSANITDNPDGSGVKNATLWYSTDNATWTTVAMEYSSGLWTGTIPGQANGTTVWYKISAFDNAENIRIDDNNHVNYSYPVVPEFTTMFLLIILAAATVAMLFYRKKGAKTL